MNLEANYNSMKHPDSFLQGYEKALFLAAVLLCELRMLIGTYLFILGEEELFFHIEIRAGEFVALGFFAFLILALFKKPNTVRQFKTVLRKFRIYDYVFLFLLAFWYLISCMLHGWSEGCALFRANEWWIYITFITSFLFFPLSEFTGATRAKEVINPMLKVILLPNMVFMAWILWQWYHNVPVLFPSGSSLLALKNFRLAVGENRLHTANRALAMLFLCLYLTESEKGWRKILYRIGGVEYLAVMVLANNRGAFYPTLAVSALVVFVKVWHRYSEKKKLLRILLGLLCAAVCVLCLYAFRKSLFLLAQYALQHSQTVDALSKTVASEARQTLPRAMTLSASANSPLQTTTTALSLNGKTDQATVIHTLSDGLSGREPLYRSSLYVMFHDWQHFLFGVTHCDVGNVIREFAGQTVTQPSAHNFFLQMGVAFGVPVMFLSVAFIALLVIRSWRIIFQKNELFPGSRMVPVVVLPLLLADMFDTTLTAGNTFPCAVFYLFAGWTVAIDRSSPAEERHCDGIRVSVFTAEIAGLAALLWRLYPWYVTLKNSGAVTLIILSTVVLLCAFWLLGQLLTILLQRQIPKLRHTLPAAVAAILFVLCLGIANGCINRITEQREDLLEQERPAIETIQSVTSCDLYVDHLPEVYFRYFGGDQHTVMHSDDLLPKQNVALITDADHECQELIERGFLYTEISNQEAIYTNSPEAAEELQAAGYHMTGYYSRTRVVDPDTTISLTSGPYRVTYELYMLFPENGSKPALDEVVAKLAVVMQGDDEPVASRDVLFLEFDEDGTCSTELDFTLKEEGEAKFLAEALGSQNKFSLQLESIQCRRNPNIDIHTVYNAEKKKIRETYFTLEGEVYTQADGSQGKEFDYDEAGNTSVIRYLDTDGKLVLNTSGFAEVRRVFNEARKIVHEEYYGTNGERIARTNGVSAADYEYDSEGNQILERYYDPEDAPVLNKSGFSERHRRFNDRKQVVSEEYFDVDRKPKNIGIGYQRFENKYTDEGKLSLTYYYDAEGNRVACGSSYFHEYLTSLYERQNVTVFLAIKDEGTNALTVTLLEDLKKLGIQTDLNGKSQYSYYAILGSKGIQEELRKDQPVSCSGVINDREYTIESAGFNAGNYSSIVIDGTEYSRNVRGMNIVVIEDGIISESIAFDTSSQIMTVTGDPLS